MLRRAYIHRGHPNASDSHGALFDGRRITDNGTESKTGLAWDPDGYWIICYQDGNSDTFLIYRSNDGGYKIYKI